MRGSRLKSGAFRIVCAVGVTAAMLAGPPAPSGALGKPAPIEVSGVIDVVTGPNQPARCATLTPGEPRSGWLIRTVTPGRTYELTATTGKWVDDFDIEFYDSEAACIARAVPLRHKNHGGNELGVVPAAAAVALVNLASGAPPAGFTYRELPDDDAKFRAPADRTPTVVAVLEPASAANSTSQNGFSPYHYDFFGWKHPWNEDADLTNDIDFDLTDPSAYIPGMPATTPVNITVPRADVPVAGLVAADADKWAAMRPSATADAASLYRFPGTKIVGAVRFGGGSGSVLPSNSRTGNVQTGPSWNDSHGSRSASVAAGNLYGTCPECVVVVVLFDGSHRDEAYTWATTQPWIDVVTNSWSTTTLEGSRPFGPMTKAAVASGQTVLWAGGNGAETQFLVPNSTYVTGQAGPDWGITVGAVSQNNDQHEGSGRPADIASYGDAYLAVGGQTTNGQGKHSGTSNATPVVAGIFATVIQRGRDLMGDITTGHAGGVVATGKALACPTGASACPMGDGVLTRAEVQAVVFDTVLPTLPRPYTLSQTGGDAEWQDLQESRTTPAAFSYTAQGHGMVVGRADADRFVAETRRLVDALRGVRPAPQRPPGERAWMKADSKCRQRLWGTWDSGYYVSGEPEPDYDETTEALAIALSGLCDQVPQDALASEDVGIPDDVERQCIRNMGTPTFTFCPFQQV